jgi:hypothetical protein
MILDREVLKAEVDTTDEEIDRFEDDFLDDYNDAHGTNFTAISSS